MQRTRIILGFGLFLVVAGPGAAQTPPGQPAEQKPLNPTQEIAKEQAEGPALEAGPAKIRIGVLLAEGRLAVPAPEGRGPTAIALSAAVGGSRRRSAALRLLLGGCLSACSPVVAPGLPAGQGIATGIATKLACGGAIRHEIRRARNRAAPKNATQSSRAAASIVAIAEMTPTCSATICANGLLQNSLKLGIRSGLSSGL
jgi:hypothetical protein